MKLFLFSVCALLFALNASAALVDLEELFQSGRSPASDSRWKYLGAHKDQSQYKLPRYLMNELKTYVDQLESEDPILDLHDHDSEVAKELKREIESIRKAMLDEELQSNDPVKLKPGQSHPINCGAFGCCSDNSKADEEGEEGCARKLCEDIFKKTCGSFSFVSKKKMCRMAFISRKCPYTCNTCKDMAAPLTVCKTQYPSQYCCWDGRIGTGPNGQGCKPCQDLYRPVCKIYKKVGGGCQSNSWRIRTFMNKNCPYTCGYCSEK